MQGSIDSSFKNLSELTVYTSGVAMPGVLKNQIMDDKVESLTLLPSPRYPQVSPW